MLPSHNESRAASHIAVGHVGIPSVAFPLAALSLGLCFTRDVADDRGMNVAAGPRLAAAVTNAGGLGVIGGVRQVR